MEAENDPIQRLSVLIEAFIRRARDEVSERLAKWPTDFAVEEFHEVVGGLLARQFTLAAELAESPKTWTHDIAPLVLRAMADVHISVAWILGDPTVRSQKFILHGLGQAKLQLEHRRADLKTRHPLDGELEKIQALEEWINSQRAMFLTNVNLGSWSGLSTRQMAEEAQCLDFYNYVYTPFSACVHSMWNHIAFHNLKVCENPLHRFHHVPRVGGPMVDPYYLYLVAKYLDKTLRAFDVAVGIRIDRDSAFTEVSRGLHALGDIEPSPETTDGSAAPNGPRETPTTP